MSTTFKKSTKTTSNFYCMDCGTNVKTKDRGDAMRDKEAAKRVEHASNRVKTLAERMSHERRFPKEVSSDAINLFCKELIS